MTRSKLHQLEIIIRLYKVWREAPELRLSQLIANLGEDNYYTEDVLFLEKLEEFYDIK